MGRLHESTDGSVHFWLWNQPVGPGNKLQLPRSSELFLPTNLANADNSIIPIMARDHRLFVPLRSHDLVGCLGFDRKPVRSIPEFHAVKPSTAGLVFQSTSHTV